MSVDFSVSTISCNGKIGFDQKKNPKPKISLIKILAYMKIDNVVKGLNSFDVSDPANKWVYKIGSIPSKKRGLKNHVGFYIIPPSRAHLTVKNTIFFRIAAEGQFQIHGIKTIDEIKEVTTVILEKLNEFNKNYNILDDPYWITDDYKHINLVLENCNIMNLNVKLEFPFSINRSTLSNILFTRYKILVTYDNDTPCVRIPYYENKEPIAVLLVYRCGKVTITGVRTWDNVIKATTWFKEIIYKYRDEIELKEWNIDTDIASISDEEMNKEELLKLVGGKDLQALRKNDFEDKIFDNFVEDNYNQILDELK